MEGQDTQTAKWLVITLSVNTAGEVIRIDEKLAGHIKELKAVDILIVPTGETVSEIPECGELSLSINNHKEHFFHSMVGHSQALPDEIIRPLKLNKEINGNPRLSGFWLDSGTVRNNERVFVPYMVKVHFEIINK